MHWHVKCISRALPALSFGEWAASLATFVRFISDFADQSLWNIWANLIPRPDSANVITSYVGYLFAFQEESAMLPIIAGAIAAILVIFAIVVQMQPSQLRVARDVTMAAPPSAVFPHVNNLHNWKAWSPWDEKDPDMTKTYEGPDEGEGASYAWAGNKDVGEGKMTITTSNPNEQVTIRLEFLKPMNVTNTSEFSFAPEGDGTRVTWELTGKNNFMGKAFGLFMNMDKMIGADFEKGLAKLKQVVEASKY